MSFWLVPMMLIFQSTLPARGATTRAEMQASIRKDFNPRSPHGERQLHNTPTPPAGDISIHAPRTGSDARPTMTAARSRRFQSTLPARGAT